MELAQVTECEGIEFRRLVRNWILRYQRRYYTAGKPPWIQLTHFGATRFHVWRGPLDIPRIARARLTGARAARTKLLCGGRRSELTFGTNRGQQMPLTLTWQEIALRLALSVVAGALIGLDRGEHGRPAGLRTTLLVCLAAAIAMIQVNLLLNTTGKATDSFVVLDLMRLPLGILTGMGFIGAGAMMRRDGLVLGVTTAATLWFVTVIGLCFGGGQISLGIAALVLGMLVLSALHWVDYKMKQERYAVLNLTTEPELPLKEEVYATVRKAGYHINVASVSYSKLSQQRELEFRLQWRVSTRNLDAPPFLKELSRDPHVLATQWRISAG
jgi:putative Mg2+ transporter-C (MgtC) family protein